MSQILGRLYTDRIHLKFTHRLSLGYRQIMNTDLRKKIKNRLQKQFISY